MRFPRPAVAALFMAALVPACGADGDASGPTGPAEVMELYPTTKVLDADALGRIAEVSPDLATVTFATTSPAVDGVVVGDIALGGIADKTPNGMLRRVTAVTRNGAAVTWTTEPAPLQAAIKNGRIRMPAVHLSPTAPRAELQPGVTMQSVAGGLAPRNVPQDGVANGGAKEDFTLGVAPFEVAKGVTLGGSIGFGLDADLDLIINPTEVSGALTLKGSETATLDVLAKYAKSWNERKDLAAYYFPPIPITILGVPMVITLKLAVSVGAEGKTNVKLAWSGRESARLTLGGKVGTGGLQPIYDGTADASADPPAVTGASDVKAKLGVRLEAAINAGLADVAMWVGADGYVGLGANTEASPCWSLHAGLDARVGAKATLLAVIPITEGEVTPNLVDKVVTSGSCGPDDAPVAPWGAVLAPSKLDTFPSVAILPDQTIVVGTLAAGNRSYAARLTREGQSIWERHYGDLVGVHEVLAGPNGTIVVGGTIDTGASFARLDPDGVPDLARQITFADFSTVGDPRFAVTSDGGIFVAGTSGVTKTFAAKFDGNGALLWSNVYDGIRTPSGIAATSDGGAVLFFEAVRAGLGYAAATRIAPDGSVVFARTYGRGSATSGTVLSNGDIALTGRGDGTGEALVVRLDANGAPIWGFSYGSVAPLELVGRGVAERSDGLIVAGRRGFAGTADGWAMLVGPDGTLGWSRAYGGTDADEFRTVRTGGDGGSVFVGTTQSFGDTHVLLTRVPPLGAITFTAPGVTQINVDGIKGSWMPTPLDLAPTVTAAPVTIVEPPLARWTGEPTVAPRTPLTP